MMNVRNDADEERAMRRAALAMLIGLAMLSVVATGTAVSGDVSPATGRLYGTVTTHAGTRYTGLIRWGGQEAFWDDLFQSLKMDLPYESYAEPVEQPEESEWWWQELAKKLVQAAEKHETRRILIARFGDISKLEVVGGNEAAVTMRSGTTYRVSGYADDVGATLTVTDPQHGTVDVAWGRVAVVEFSPAPADLTFPGFRLFGTVDAGGPVFSGFIQWDQDEGLSSDRLDGDGDGGRLSIPFGTISSIVPVSSAKARVELTDGRELVLGGTNDVNGSNRGILIEDPRYGRVEVEWGVLRRVDLSQPDGSGRSYREFTTPQPLRGTVTLTDGSTVEGTIHFDLDESESWEMLNGGSGGISYDIPFSSVRSIERGDNASLVTLTNGEALRLDEGQDVGAHNAGVVVELASGGETFRPWRDVRRVDLSW
jgi:hypothetical protein